MATQSNARELRVFISSTFRDLQVEREHLVKKVFPELRAICRERGITLTEVDLRWGITDEDKIQGRVIRTCLEELDRCRPYFIGITGDRYGYIPVPEEITNDPELLTRYPWIEQAIASGASITDLEFQSGALNEAALGERPRANFYFRHLPVVWESEKSQDQKQLEALQARVAAAGYRTDEYSDPVTLGKLVYDGLLQVVNEDFGDVKARTPLEDERAKHEAFAHSRRLAYVADPKYVERLDQFAESEEPPLILYAESGSGKSSLIAYWAEEHRQKHPGAHVVEHYIGIGASATDHYGVMRHVMEEIKERFNRTEEIPGTPQEIERQFANWLGFTLDSPMVLIIDAVNQLSGVALNLEWVPRFFPPKIRFIITTTVEETLVHLRERGWGELGIQPLHEKEREIIIKRLLGQYGKALSAKQVQRIAEDEKCAHPLFLRTVLEELRLFGRHEDLESQIDRYLATTGTEDLFQVVLHRFEQDFGESLVRDILSLIWATRTGLSEIELQELIGVSRMEIASVVIALDYHFLRNEGLLTFFHDFLRRAVEKRYLPDEPAQVAKHLILADYFEKVVDELIARDEAAEAAEREALEVA